jgi:multiple sugar transport system substrate-binding protein
MGLAGVGFSAFGLGMLGNPRGLRRGSSLIGTEAYADGLPDNQAKWLKDVGSKFKGAKIRYSTESTPPSVVLNQIKKEFTDPTGIEVEVEIVPLEQVLAKATQDVQGQLGSYDLYYLDQSWISMFQPDCIDPVAYYKDKPELAMPDFDWDDFSKPLVKNVAQVDGQWMGIPFDIPIFTLMYRKDILEKHKIAVPTTYEDFLVAARQISEAEKSNGIFGTGLQAKSGHYSLECDWSQAVWGHGGSIFNKNKKFSGNDEQGVAGSEVVPGAPEGVAAELHGIDLGWPVRDDAFRPGGAGAELGRILPGLDADDSKVKGLWEPAKPLTAKKLRAPADAGFNEQPNLGHQGGSCISLSKYSKNKEAAWIFMQWGCCKEIMTRCTLLGGFAPMRNSSFADPRVKAKAKVGPGTTRHLETVKWVIDNAMATEPHMALWAGLSTNEIPTELGKLLTGQAYGGDPQKCMDALAKDIDAKVKDAGLL